MLKGLVLVALTTCFGYLLRNLAWIGYYIRRRHNAHYATVFSVSAITTAATLLLYPWLVKFMERPQGKLLGPCRLQQKQNLMKFIK